MSTSGARRRATTLWWRHAHAAGRRRRRDRRRPRGPPLTLVRAAPPDALLPHVARCYPGRYDALLAEKVARLEALVHSAAPPASPALRAEVFPSAPLHFRNRAAFKLWRDADARVHYVMFNHAEGTDTRNPHACPTFPMGSLEINRLMPLLRDALDASPDVLARRVNDVRFLTTHRTGQAVVTLTYNRPIGGGGGAEDGAEEGAWAAEATRLARALGPRVALVGRSRGVKVVVPAVEASSSACRGADADADADADGDGGTDGDTVEDVLRVGGPDDDGRDCVLTQQEGAFTQPNAGVCEKMLTWAWDATRRETDGDAGDHGDSRGLCELYCGNGTFTVALAPNFDCVVATELSRASVRLARRNLRRNAGAAHARVAKLSAAEFALAHAGRRQFRRLRDAGVASHAELAGLQTLFVDPPRAGLDAATRGLAAAFERVVYVSCNPETLSRDLAALRDTHAVARLAAFDQFPYTPHLEAGVVLEKKNRSA
jgi:tRNA (uracil-5-)-methyltransferase